MSLAAPPAPHLVAAASTVAMLLADARLPSGGHAHSAGLEPALLSGMPVAEVAAYLRARAATTGLVDAATAVVARAAVRAGKPLDAVERAWAARTPSRAAREAARDLGRGLLRLARAVWPDAAAPFAAAERVPPRPLVLGAIAAHAGIDAAEIARLAVYDDTASAVSALLKLEPGDPADGVSLVLTTCASVDARIPALAALVSSDEIPAPSAPHAEAWIEAHARSNRRLFRA